MRIPNPPVREARCIFADGVPEPPSPGPFLLPRHDPSAARGRGAFERACLHGYPARCIRLPMPPKSLPPSPPGEVPPDCLSSPAPSRPPPTRSVRASDGRRCRGRGRDLHPPAPSSSRGTIHPRQEEGVPLSGLACTGIRHDASGYPCHPCPSSARGDARPPAFHARVSGTMHPATHATHVPSPWAQKEAGRGWSPSPPVVGAGAPTGCCRARPTDP
jgi:hypothetical protein